METLYFSLGIVTALVAILFVVGVVMIVRLTKKQLNLENTINYIERYNQEGRNNLQKELSDLYSTMDRRTADIYRDINDRHDSITREMERQIEQSFRRTDELNSYVDSRFDKLLNKINNNPETTLLKD